MKRILMRIFIFLFLSSSVVFSLNSTEVIPTNGLDKIDLLKHNFNIFTDPSYNLCETTDSKGVIFTKRTVVFNAVYDIDTLKDASKVLITATDSGIYRVEAKINYLDTIPFYEDSNKTSSDFTAIMNAKIDTIIQTSISNEIIDGYKIHADYTGNIWVATSEGLMKYSNGNWSKFVYSVDIPSGKIKSFSSNNDSLLVTTSKNCYTIIGSEVNVYNLFEDSSDDTIYCGVLYKDQIFLGTTKGLQHYVETEFVTRKIEGNEKYVKETMKYYGVNSIFMDSKDQSLYVTPLFIDTLDKSVARSIVNFHSIGDSLTNIDFQLINYNHHSGVTYSMFNYNELRVFVFLDWFLDAPYINEIKYSIENKQTSSGAVRVVNPSLHPTDILINNKLFFMGDYMWTTTANGNLILSVNYKDTYDYSKVKDVEVTVSEAILNNVYPNPFNPTTTISFSLPQAEAVKISVYNIKGEKLTTLYNTVAIAGLTSLDFNASKYASGVYFVRMVTGNGIIQNRKMILIK